MKILNILIDKLNLSPQETTAFDIWLGELQRDALTLAGVTTVRGGGAGVDTGNVVISFEDGVTLYNPDSGYRTVSMAPEGDISFGRNIDSPSQTAFKVFANKQTYNSEEMGEGDWLAGDNSANKANLLWDLSTGQLKFRTGTTEGITLDTDGTIIVGASAPNIIIDGVNKNIRSSNYSSGAAGFQINALNGDAEFNNITARGTFRASVFEIGTITAVGGSVLISKNASEVWEDTTTGATFTLKLKDTVGDVSTAAVNDRLRIKDWNEACS